jgi:hypothetical protein
MFTAINNSAVWAKLHALSYAVALSLCASVCCGQTQKGDESLTKDLFSAPGPTFRVARTSFRRSGL